MAHKKNRGEQHEPHSAGGRLLGTRKCWVQTVGKRLSGVILFAWVLLSVLLMLAGCDGLGKNPFSLRINRFNEEGPQQPAAITVSDPQIYSREALVNDRLREATLIKSLLEETEKLSFRDKFEPQIARDLVNMQALVAQIQASFDPTKGAAAKRTESLNDTRNEITRLKLERDKVIAQRRLEAANEPGNRSFHTVGKRRQQRLRSRFGAGLVGAR